jgi:hypothetical protein
MILQVLASEFPAEWLGGAVVALLETEDTLGNSDAIRQVQRREDLALDNREVDFDLIQPTGMCRRMHDAVRASVRAAFAHASRVWLGSPLKRDLSSALRKPRVSRCTAQRVL